MGGKEGIRGYVYQTIISVIQALTVPSWEFIQIEPNTENEKVDIILEAKDNQKTCIQVKSSISNFQKSDIVTWLEGLIKATKDSSGYELILIGNVSKETNDFIKATSENVTVNGQGLINANIDKIKVELVPFNQGYLENQIKFLLIKYFELYDITVSTSAVGNIMGGLMYQFLQFSILGRRISKVDLSDFFLQWIKFNYPKELIDKKSSQLQINFYDRVSQSFSTTGLIQKLDLRNNSILRNQISKVNKAYQDALSIVLPARTKNEKETETNDWYSSRLTFNLTEPTEADISEEIKLEIQKCIDRHLGIKIKSEFFNVGDIMKKPFNALSFIMPNQQDYLGTELELKKTWVNRSSLLGGFKFKRFDYFFRIFK